ncbi:hypothetical protein [Methylobacterium sp. CCH5-D2]|uniref:hypothetical protein n=1 Tax=Methylobacterium sp. CCH5-D2 TaxID=1768765 RepID=UPI0008297992|nr:hypothetical protein [Methylobacterium sp. CCH5-D2]
MGVVDLKAHVEARQAEAWENYVAAKQRADETLALEDGLAASRAWRAFLQIFIPDPAERREVMR